MPGFDSWIFSSSNPRLGGHLFPQARPVLKGHTATDVEAQGIGAKAADLLRAGVAYKSESNHNWIGLWDILDCFFGLLCSVVVLSYLDEFDFCSV